MKMIKYTCVIVSLILILAHNTHAIKILGTNGTQISFSTPAFTGNKMQIENGKIISYLGLIGFTQSDLQSCKRANPTAFVNQSIAIVASFGGCSIERHIQVAQEAGAVAVIVATDQIWKYCNTIDRDHSSFILNIPAVCIGADDMAKLTKIVIENGSQNPPQPTIAIFTAEPNEYLSLNKGGMYFFTIFYFINFVIIAIIALIKLIYFWKIEGFSITVPKFLTALVLYIGIAMCLFSLDFQGYHRWYGHYMQFDITGTFMFLSASLYGFLLLAANLANVIAKVSARKKLYQGIIYGSLGFLAFFFTITNITFAGYGYSWNLNKRIGGTLTWLTMGILATCCLIFMCTSIFLVFKLTNLSKETNKFKGKRKYKLLAASLLVAFFAAMFGTIAAIIQAQTYYQNIPRAYLGCFAVILFVDMIFCYLVIAIYQPNAKKGGSGSTSRQNSKKFENLSKSDNNNESNEPNVSSFEVN